MLKFNSTGIFLHFGPSKKILVYLTLNVNRYHLMLTDFVGPNWIFYA